MAQALGSGEGAPGEKADAIADTARRGLADVRRAIVDLDPTGLDAGGLTEMVAQALERFRERTGCAVTLDVEGDPSDLPTGVARATYRVAQEALMNVRLHANATTVRVELSARRDLTLAIEDDGVGFDTRTALQAAGLGLRHMRERTDALGGFLTLTSEPGAGTTIRLKVPQVRDARRAETPPTAGAAGDQLQDATLRIFVAETNVLVSGGISRVIDADGNMRIVGEARTLDETKARLRQLQPDVALVSTALAREGVEALIAEVRRASPLSAILAVAHGDGSQDAKLIAAGATGVVDRGIEENGLAQAVRAVACGTRVLGGSRNMAKGGDDCEALTAREQSILTLVARGETNAEIGRTLYLATKTVERQVATIVRKLRARNRAHASAIGVARHIVELSG
jgi:DNA-binding NarL/FixJ family response regulator/two-component sensor histidine kinase